MTAEIKIVGRIRKPMEGIDQASPGDEEQLVLNEQLEQLVALGASQYGEIVRLGRAFKVNNTTAVAAVIALPTTAVNMALFNNEADGTGRSYVVDRVWALQIAAATQADANSLIGVLGQVREAAPADAGLLFRKLNGMGTGSDTKARSIIGGTALPATTGIAADWFPMPGQSTNAQVGAFVGCMIECQVNGRIIVPPGRYLGLNVLSGHVTNTFICGVEWHERYIRVL